MVDQITHDRQKRILEHRILHAKEEAMNLLLVLNEMNLKSLQASGYESHHIARERVVRQVRDRIRAMEMEFGQNYPLGFGVVA